MWSPTIGEELSARQEHDNPYDKYAVSIMKSGNRVGHIPKEISETCWNFIDSGGEIQCRVTGRFEQSTLPQGGLEVPCEYKCSGKKNQVMIVASLLQELKYKIIDEKLE